jgi:hypothetical protein
MSRRNVILVIINVVLAIATEIFASSIQKNLCPELPNIFFTILTIVLITTVVGLVCFDWFKSQFDQFNIGKLRGLFFSTYLDRQIERHFKNSSEVKIKVTRGFGLFVDSKNVFHRCICKDDGKDKRIIKILLHYPCLKSEHVKVRVKAYPNKSVEDYVTEVIRVLKQLKDVTNDDENPNQVIVKLYSDLEIEWRYYIFKHRFSQKLVGFFCHYIRKPGPDIPMFKVLFDNGNLCNYFDDSFDQIFNDDRKSILLLDNSAKQYRFNNLYHCKHPECKILLQKKFNEVFNINP